MVLVDAAGGENQNVGSGPVCPVDFDEQTIHCTVKRCTLVISDRNGHNLEAFHFHIFKFQKVGIGQDRIVDL